MGTKELYEKAKRFVGEKAFYLKEEGVLKEVRETKNMVIAYLDNGITVNFTLLKNEKGEYFEDLEKKEGAE